MSTARLHTYPKFATDSLLWYRLFQIGNCWLSSNYSLGPPFLGPLPWARADLGAFSSLLLPQCSATCPARSRRIQGLACLRCCLFWWVVLPNWKIWSGTWYVEVVVHWVASCCWRCIGRGEVSGSPCHWSATSLPGDRRHCRLERTPLSRLVGLLWWDCCNLLPQQASHFADCIRSAKREDNYGVSNIVLPCPSS